MLYEKAIHHSLLPKSLKTSLAALSSPLEKGKSPKKVYA
jgi:hypothetical protein